MIMQIYNRQFVNKSLISRFSFIHYISQYSFSLTLILPRFFVQKCLLIMSAAKCFLDLFIMEANTMSPDQNALNGAV